MAHNLETFYWTFPRMSISIVTIMRYTDSHERLMPLMMFVWTRTFPRTRKCDTRRGQTHNEWGGCRVFHTIEPGRRLQCRVPVLKWSGLTDAERDNGSAAPLISQSCHPSLLVWTTQLLTHRPHLSRRRVSPGFLVRPFIGQTCYSTGLWLDLRCDQTNDRPLILSTQTIKLIIYHEL